MANKDVFLKSDKRDNTRQHKGGGPRPDHDEHQRQGAKERGAQWATLSPTDQIATLDRRLGKGVGAAKQRERIYARMATWKVVPKVTEPATTVPPKEHVKAKDRRAAERAKQPSR